MDEDDVRSAQDLDRTPLIVEKQMPQSPKPQKRNEMLDERSPHFADDDD